MFEPDKAWHPTMGNRAPHQVAKMVDVITWVMLVLGSGLVLVGGIGILRMPDVYTRLHAGGITDTLGAGLILVGLMTQSGWGGATIKLCLILAFLFFTNPTASHLLARTALKFGVNPQPESKKGSSSKV